MLNTPEEIIDDLRHGKMVILMDDEDRENEGDLVMVSELVRPEDINFMATHARGLICLTITQERAKLLNLAPMATQNKSQFSTNFTASIEAAVGVTTGISAADRAHTIRTAVAPTAVAADIVQPGHIFPVVAMAGGVMSRAGHTEAGCDLARLAGFEPSSTIVEIMNDDGTMARRADLERFAEQFDLKIGTIADLIHYRATREKTVDVVAVREVDTAFGAFTLHTYRDSQGDLHFAMVRGQLSDAPTLVRVHVLDTARDLLQVRRTDSTRAPIWTYPAAMEAVARADNGVVLLICHDESTAAVDAGVAAILSGKQQKPSPDVLYKQVGTGSQILRDLGVRKMRLMSSPMRFSALSGFGLEVVEYVSPELKVSY